MNEGAWTGRRSTLAGLAAILALAAVAYGNTLGVPFVWDDIREVRENVALDTLWPPSVAMFEGGRLPHRPLPYYTFALNRRLNRTLGLAADDVRSFHVLNLGIHFVNAALVWWVVARGLRRLERPAREADAMGWAAAALWLCHPLNTQAVTYVYQRIESLAAGFSLATLGCFIVSLDARRPRAWLAASIVCCGLGMASKETAAVTPLLVAAYAALASHRAPTSRLGILRNHLAYFGCLAASWAVIVAVMLWQRGRYPELAQSGAAWWSYALNQPLVILQYLRLVPWPHPLLFDPDWRRVTDWRLLVPAWLAIGAVVGWAVVASKSRPAATFLVLAFFIALAPSSSIIPASAGRPYAEYRMYLPLVFVVVGLVAAVGTFVTSRPGLAVATILALALAMGSRARNEAYATAPTLWADTFTKQPFNRRALHNLVTFLLQQGRDDVVLTLYDGLGRSLDDDLESLAGKSNLLRAAGRIDEAESAAAAAIRLARRTLEANPRDATAWFHLGNLLRESRPEDAADAFSRAVRLDPRQADARSNLGAMLARSSPREAERLYREALAIDPVHADAHSNLGSLLARRGDVAEARQHLEAALRQEPAHPTARRNLERLEAAQP
ncbi:MAG: tetratricopeptide repeat protein [Planctomycetia bacterium]|nr:tetratricopeptide repeat protein [Planctomycetia bacterium]